MTFNKRTIGADKEQLAAEYLIDKIIIWYLLRLNIEAVHAMVLLLKLSIIKNSRL